MSWFGLAGTVIGGLFGNRQQRRAAEAQTENRVGDRRWFLADRRYQERRDDQLYQRSKRDAYSREDTQVADARARDDALYRRYLGEKSADAAVERSRVAQERALALERGVDWKRLRDEAASAGFNPLTAVGMAGAYSRDATGFSVPGPGAAAPGGGGGGGGGSFSVGGGSTVSMGDYQSAHTPVLASGEWIRDAMAQVGRTWFNEDAPEDPFSTAYKVAYAGELARQQFEKANPPRKAFGYDLTKVTPSSIGMQTRGATATLSAATARRSANAKGVPETGYVNVIDVDGTPTQIHSGVAKTHGVKEGDHLPIEFYESQQGEVATEVRALGTWAGNEVHMKGDRASPIAKGLRRFDQAVEATARWGAARRARSERRMQEFQEDFDFQ